MGYSGPPYKTFAILADDPQGDQIVSVIAKRTYDLGSKGSLTHSEEQAEIVNEEAYEEKDNLPGRARHMPPAAGRSKNSRRL